MIERTQQLGEKFYFRSFSSHRHPLQPRGRIAFLEAQALSTYYVATYDNHRRLIEFSKMLRRIDDKQGEWHVVFTEAYSYFDSGNVKRRTLRIPGKTDQSWEFEDQRQFWSSYLERLCSWWFRRVGPDDPSPAQFALLVHELFTEVELATFEASIGVVKDDEWAYNVTMRMLNSARDIIRQVDSNAGPRICAVAITEDKCEGTVWRGFDEPELSLFGIINSWRENHLDTDELETVTLLPERDLDDLGRRWASDSRIGSITFAPIRVADGDELVAAAMLVLTTERSANDDCLRVVTSIFRRIVAQIQLILELARLYQTSNRDSRWP